MNYLLYLLMNFDRGMEAMDSYCDYGKLPRSWIVSEVYSYLN